jgi:hypothetical protein
MPRRLGTTVEKAGKGERGGAEARRKDRRALRKDKLIANFG